MTVTEWLYALVLASAVAGLLVVGYLDASVDGRDVPAAGEHERVTCQGQLGPEWEFHDEFEALNGTRMLRCVRAVEGGVWP